MRSGAHPTIVCVPGLGLDERAWQPTVDALADRDPDASVVVTPLPGFGLRPSRADDLRPEALAERLVHRLSATSRTSGGLVLVGHSASAQVAAHAAALSPFEVSALVLVGPTTDPRSRSWAGIAGRWLRTAVWERPGQVPRLARMYTRTGLVWMLRTMDTARRDDISAPLGRVACPVVVVRGRHDRICPEDWGRDVAGKTPTGGRTVTLAAGAHMVPLTHGDLVADLLLDVRRTLPGR